MINLERINLKISCSKILNILIEKNHKNVVLIFPGSGGSSQRYRKKRNL